ncbi:MAG: hypothetical protein R2939_16200 [Kofleriaceae bacterium]
MRTPLWIQRQKAQQLLGVAVRYPSFPIVLEAYRECLRDVFDVPALHALLGQVARGEVRVAEVATDGASPFASGLVFDVVAAFLYEGDAPAAERRAQALTLDRALLRDLLGDGAQRALLDPAAMAEVEAEPPGPPTGAARATPTSSPICCAGSATLAADELAGRAAPDLDLDAALAALHAARRAVPITVGGQRRWIAAEDAGATAGSARWYPTTTPPRPTRCRCQACSRASLAPAGRSPSTSWPRGGASRRLAQPPSTPRSAAASWMRAAPGW